MAPYQRVWDVDRPPRPNWDVDRTKAEAGANFIRSFTMGALIVFSIALFPVVGYVLFYRRYGDPVDLISYSARRSWMKLVETARRLWMMLIKVARWICCVKTEPPVQPQPQESGIESGIELQPSCPPPNDASTSPPEDASSPPQREGSSHRRSSDSGLTTLREESLDSSTSAQTVVESPTDTAISSAQTVVATA